MSMLNHNLLDEYITNVINQKENFYEKNGIKFNRHYEFDQEKAAIETAGEFFIWKHYRQKTGDIKKCDFTIINCFSKGKSGTLTIHVKYKPQEYGNEHESVWKIDNYYNNLKEDKNWKLLIRNRPNIAESTNFVGFTYIENYSPDELKDDVNYRTVNEYTLANNREPVEDTDYISLEEYLNGNEKDKLSGKIKEWIEKLDTIKSSYSRKKILHKIIALKDMIEKDFKVILDGIFSRKIGIGQLNTFAAVDDYASDEELRKLFGAFSPPDFIIDITNLISLKPTDDVDKTIPDSFKDITNTDIDIKADVSHIEFSPYYDSTRKHYDGLDIKIVLKNGYRMDAKVEHKSINDDGNIRDLIDTLYSIIKDENRKLHIKAKITKRKRDILSKQFNDILTSYGVNKTEAHNLALELSQGIDSLIKDKMFYKMIGMKHFYDTNLNNFLINNKNKSIAIIDYAEIKHGDYCTDFVKLELNIIQLFFNQIIKDDFYSNSEKNSDAKINDFLNVEKNTLIYEDRDKRYVDELVDTIIGENANPYKLKQMFILQLLLIIIRSHFIEYVKEDEIFNDQNKENGAISQYIHSMLFNSLQFMRYKGISPAQAKFLFEKVKLQLNVSLEQRNKVQYIEEYKEYVEESNPLNWNKSQTKYATKIAIVSVIFFLIWVCSVSVSRFGHFDYYYNQYSKRLETLMSDDEQNQGDIMVIDFSYSSLDKIGWRFEFVKFLESLHKHCASSLDGKGAYPGAIAFDFGLVALFRYCNQYTVEDFYPYLFNDENIPRSKLFFTSNDPDGNDDFSRLNEIINIYEIDDPTQIRKEYYCLDKDQQDEIKQLFINKVIENTGDDFTHDDDIGINDVSDNFVLEFFSYCRLVNALRRFDPVDRPDQGIFQRKTYLIFAIHTLDNEGEDRITYTKLNNFIEEYNLIAHVETIGGKRFETTNPKLIKAEKIRLISSDKEDTIIYPSLALALHLAMVNAREGNTKWQKDKDYEIWKDLADLRIYYSDEYHITHFNGLPKYFPTEENELKVNVYRHTNQNLPLFDINDAVLVGQVNNYLSGVEFKDTSLTQAYGENSVSGLEVHLNAYKTISALYPDPLQQEPQKAFRLFELDGWPSICLSALIYSFIMLILWFVLLKCLKLRIKRRLKKKNPNISELKNSFFYKNFKLPAIIASLCATGIFVGLFYLTPIFGLFHYDVITPIFGILLSGAGIYLVYSIDYYEISFYSFKRKNKNLK